MTRALSLLAFAYRLRRARRLFAAGRRREAKQVLDALARNPHVT